MSRSTLRQTLLTLKETLVPKEGLRERTVKSGIWAGMMSVGGRALQLLKLVVLARLLSPADFGLMGIALLTLAVLEQFSKLGLDTALIQREEENVDDYLDTAWSIQILRGVAIAGAAILLAPSAAAFFGEPRVTDIIRVIAILPLVIGFQNPGIVYLEKNLEFHRRFLYALSGPVANVSISIVLALVLRNVWALVFGSVAGTIVTLLLSYYIHEYRPGLGFDWNKARELYGYGKWITASSIVVFLITQGDDAFVGWFLSASALGFYQIAYRLSSAPAKEVSSVISSVIFPAYSQIQTDSEKLRNTCYKSVQLVSVISFPVTIGIIVTAPVFTRAILGEQWLPMVRVLQVLAVWGGLRALTITVGPVFRAIGRPDYNTKLQVLQLAVIAIAIYPATATWDIAGTGLAIVLSGLLSTPILVLWTLREIDGSGLELARILFYPALASAVMGVGLLSLRSAVVSNPLLELTVLVLVGAAIYGLAMLGFDRHFDYGIKALLRQIVETVR